MITEYLARGWVIVPLHNVDTDGRCSCGRTDCPPKTRGKHPVYGNWQRLQLDVDTLAAIYRARPAANVGIATGRPSGFWALDVDDLTALEALPFRLPAPLQRTGSGGLHFLFALPPDFDPSNSAGRLPKGIDVRGTGGQIVVPPSVSGRGAYQLLDPALTVHAPPAELLELVRPLPYERRRESAATPVDMAGPDAVRAGAYATKVILAECTELANEQHTRNTKAFQVACRLHELINAGFTSYDYAEAQYLEACERADANKTERFSEHEARSVWANAAHRVGDGRAELPPSALGGERLDFPQPSLGSSSTLEAGPSLEEMLASGGSLAGPDQPPVALPSDLTLPAEFWDARPVFKHIREAAHSRLVSADVAFYTVLTRLAALWPHRVQLDSGVRMPAAANVFVAMCGQSGHGKTSGVGVAQELLGLPPWLERDAFADGLPLGSGEGIAEAFMGTAKRAKLDTEGQPIVMRTGEAKTESYRTQVRHNVLMYADEGEALAKLLERSGATIGETLRRAWVGSTIGQANGRAETTRIVEKGRYSLGLVIGFQPETAQLLLADVAPGTPQRFLWAWVIDPTLPDHPVAHPGPLTGVWPSPPPPPGEGFGPWLIDPGGTAVDLRPVTFPAAVRDELWQEARLVGKGELELPAYDSHRPLHLVKISALLAQLDGRRDVSEDDWRLARIVWTTSCRVRDHMIEYGRLMGLKVRAAQRHLRGQDAADAESARHVVLDAREGAAVERVAQVVARRVQHADGELPLREVRNAVASRDRRDGRFEPALAAALERQWVIGRPDGTLVAGPVRVG